MQMCEIQTTVFFRPCKQHCWWKKEFMTLNTMLNRSHLQIAAILTLKFLILTSAFMYNALGDVGDITTSYKLHCFH